MSRVGVDLSSYENGGYYPGSILIRIAWMLVSCIFFETRFPFPSAVKSTLLRLFGADVGRGVVLKPSIKIKYPWMLQIGNNTWVGEQVWIDNLANITIGDNCCVSQGAMLLTGNHDFTVQSFDLIVKPIILADGVWIGAKSVVCPGVELGKCSVLSVGSVATTVVKEYAVYQGNPAQFKKERLILGKSKI